MNGLETLLPYLITAVVGWALRHWGLVKPGTPQPNVPEGNPTIDELLKRLRELFAQEQSRAQQEAVQRTIEKLQK